MDASSCPGCLERDQRNAQLEVRILQLETALRDLQDKLKPPQPKSHEKLPPAPPKKKTGRKPGGQPGHPPQFKTLLPPERVDTHVRLIPETCHACSALLPQEPGPADPEPHLFQVAELPPKLIEITQYEGHARICPCCGEVTRQSIPADIRAHSLGPTFTAFLGYLMGVHGVSKRGVEEIVESVFELPISVGTIVNFQEQISEALAPAHAEARAAIAAEPVKHVDETGWKEAGKKRWLWVAASSLVCLFVIHPRRNLEALKRTVGERLSGLLCSDRWRVYDRWPGLRQLCWAHLKRNWEKQGERVKAAAPLMDAWLEAHRKVFELWHRFREEKISRDELDRLIIPLYIEMWQILKRGQSSRSRKFARFCKRLAGRYEHMWTFVTVEGVEPTNNHGERVLRLAVLWRKKSFGCHSPAGCRFVERILTVVQTLKLQGRSRLDFLRQAVEAYRQGTKSPQLILNG